MVNLKKKIYKSNVSFKSGLETHLPSTPTSWKCNNAIWSMQNGPQRWTHNLVVTNNVGK